MGAGARGVAGWLVPIPAASRTSLVAAMRRLMSAEAHQDWTTVYRLRPELDRETETEEQFTRRWKEISPDAVLDFEPLHTSPSNFAGVSPDEQVFDVLGCAMVERDGSKASEEGSISAHLVGGTWYLDGVHLLMNDNDQPEPCRFQPGSGILAAPRRR